MTSLRAEHGGAAVILLLMLPHQTHSPSTLLPPCLDRWIDNAEVLARGKYYDLKDTIKGHMVLDYDLWRAMRMLPEKITIPLRWEKVDSHIDTREYADEETPNVDEFSIQLNICADERAGSIWVTDYFVRDKSISNILYDEGPVVVRLND